MTAERIRTALVEMRSLLDEIRTEQVNNRQIEYQNALQRLLPLAERLAASTIEELERVESQ